MPPVRLGPAPQPLTCSSSSCSCNILCCISMSSCRKTTREKQGARKDAMQHAGACLGQLLALLLERLHLVLLRFQHFGGRYQAGVDIRTAAAAALPQEALLLLEPLQALHTRVRGERVVLKAAAAGTGVRVE